MVATRNAQSRMLVNVERFRRAGWIDHVANFMKSETRIREGASWTLLKLDA